MGRSDAPTEILAEPFPDTNPQRRGTNGTRICPSKPEGFTYLSKMLGEYLDHGKESGLDYVIAFPYDSGGCGCKECWPWGGRCCRNGCGGGERGQQQGEPRRGDGCRV